MVTAALVWMLLLSLCQFGIALRRGFLGASFVVKAIPIQTREAEFDLEYTHLFDVVISYSECSWSEMEQIQKNFLCGWGALDRRPHWSN